LWKIGEKEGQRDKSVEWSRYWKAKGRNEKSPWGLHWKLRSFVEFTVNIRTVRGRLQWTGRVE
jgi:hypothetical protein